MPHDFQSVRALLRTPDSKIREIVTGTLANFGCRRLVTIDHGADMEPYLRADMIDLLVVDAESGLQEACGMVQRMRASPAGDNSFAATIILTGTPDPHCIAHLIDSGADTILIKPLQANALAERITALVQRRNAFVVTSDYVGPERRGEGQRPGSESAPRVTVPNPLREMTVGAMSRDELRRGVRASWETVNEHRIERQAAHLGWLVEQVREAFTGQPPSDRARDSIIALRNAAAELRLRVDGCGYDHVAHLATTMVDICCGLGVALNTPDRRWLAVMPQLAASIAKAFLRERDTIRAGRKEAGIRACRPRSGSSSGSPTLPQACH